MVLNSCSPSLVFSSSSLFFASGTKVPLPLHALVSPHLLYRPPVRCNGSRISHVFFSTSPLLTGGEQARVCPFASLSYSPPRQKIPQTSTQHNKREGKTKEETPAFCCLPEVVPDRIVGQVFFEDFLSSPKCIALWLNVFASRLDKLQLDYESQTKARLHQKERPPASALSPAAPPAPSSLSPPDFWEVAWQTAESACLRHSLRSSSSSPSAPGRLPAPPQHRTGESLGSSSSSSSRSFPSSSSMDSEQNKEETKTARTSCFSSSPSFGSSKSSSSLSSFSRADASAEASSTLESSSRSLSGSSASLSQPSFLSVASAPLSLSSFWHAAVDLLLLPVYSSASRSPSPSSSFLSSSSSSCSSREQWKRERSLQESSPASSFSRTDSSPPLLEVRTLAVAANALVRVFKVGNRKASILRLSRPPSSADSPLASPSSPPTSSSPCSLFFLAFSSRLAKAQPAVPNPSAFPFDLPQRDLRGLLLRLLRARHWGGEEGRRHAEGAEKEPAEEEEEEKQAAVWELNEQDASLLAHACAVAECLYTPFFRGLEKRLASSAPVGGEVSTADRHTRGKRRREREDGGCSRKAEEQGKTGKKVPHTTDGCGVDAPGRIDKDKVSCVDDCYQDERKEKERKEGGTGDNKEGRMVTGGEGGGGGGGVSTPDVLPCVLGATGDQNGSSFTTDQKWSPPVAQDEKESPRKASREQRSASWVLSVRSSPGRHATENKSRQTPPNVVGEGISRRSDAAPSSPVRTTPELLPSNSPVRREGGDLFLSSFTPQGLSLLLHAFACLGVSFTPSVAARCAKAAIEVLQAGTRRGDEGSVEGRRGDGSARRALRTEGFQTSSSSFPEEGPHRSLQERRTRRILQGITPEHQTRLLYALVEWSAVPRPIAKSAALLVARGKLRTHPHLFAVQGRLLALSCILALGLHLPECTQVLKGQLSLPLPPRIISLFPSILDSLSIYLCGPICLSVSLLLSIHLLVSLCLSVYLPRAIRVSYMSMDVQLPCSWSFIPKAVERGRTMPHEHFLSRLSLPDFVVVCCLTRKPKAAEDKRRICAKRSASAL